MPYSVRRPANLPKGYVWFVPDVGDNHLDLKAPFRVFMRPLSKRELDGIRAKALSLGISSPGFIMQEAVLLTVREVRDVDLEDVETGEILRPTNGETLVDACKRTDGFNGDAIIDRVGAAANSMSYMALGELGNLRRQQQLDLESGGPLVDGLAPAAGALMTTSSASVETPSDHGEGATLHAPADGL